LSPAGFLSNSFQLRVASAELAPDAPLFALAMSGG
jgi:hypothetical protein